MEIIEVVELKRLPEEIAHLMSEGERAGYRFLRRLVDEWDSGGNRFDERGEVLLGASVRGGFLLRAVELTQAEMYGFRQWFLLLVVLL